MNLPYTYNFTNSHMRWYPYEFSPGMIFEFVAFKRFRFFTVPMPFMREQPR